MRSFFAFFRKELIESARSGKLMILGVLFFTFGVMNPAVAKLTPWLLEMMAEELAESGMSVGEISVDALTSWTQFFKNIPMALIAFVFMYSSTLTREYESGTLVLMLTRGLARSKVLSAKTSLLLILWSAGYFLCFGVTYAYNAFYWDNSVARSLSVAVFNWWLFGVLVVALMMLFSVLSKSYSGVLLGTGGSVLAIYFASLVPQAAKFMPIKLMNGMELLTGVSCTSDFTAAIVVTVASAAACIALALPLLNKKQI